MIDAWIVVVGGPPAWGPCGSHALRMAEAFWALGLKVLYVESGGDAGPFRRALGRSKQEGQTVVTDLERRGFFVMRAAQLPLLPLAFPEPVRRWNRSRTAARIARFLAAVSAPHVIVCHYDWRWPDILPGSLQTVSHVYECTDDHRNAPEVLATPMLERHVRRTERKLLDQADLVVFTSRLLAASSERRGRRVVLPVGVDAAHFAGPATGDPHDAQGVPERRSDRPRIGFVGRLTGRSDWAMVRAAAIETPDWQWIAAGPAAGIEPRGPDNLHWVGPVAYDDLPAWLRHWHVGLVPSVANTEFNRRSSPMRLLEYLAAGLPVASTDIPAARELAQQLPGQVFIADDYSSHCLAETVRRALAVPAWKREGGRTFARRHPWRERAERLLTLLEGVAPAVAGNIRHTPQTR